MVWFGGERGGGREDPAASGAFIYTILSQWADSDKVPPHHLNDPSFSRVRAERKGGFLEQRLQPVGYEDAEAGLVQV